MRTERNCMVYLFSRWGLIEFIRWQCKIESKKCFLFKSAEIDKLEMILLWIAGFFRSFVCAASRQIIEINSTHTQRAQSKSICWLERLSEYFTIEPKKCAHMVYFTACQSDRQRRTRKKKHIVRCRKKSGVWRSICSRDKWTLTSPSAQFSSDKRRDTYSDTQRYLFRSVDMATCYTKPDTFFF